MKEALMLLLVLLIGVFTSQSFGYNVTMTDTKLLDAVYERVDYLKLTDNGRLVEILGKLPSVIDRFEGRPQESFLLTQIYNYVDLTLNPRNAQQPSNDGNYSEGMIEALGGMFN